MQIFVARQPIFDARKEVFAYELLFRSGMENVYSAGLDGDRTTSSVISGSMLVFGLETLTKGKRAFINFTRNLLIRGAPADMPCDQIAIEVLESVEPDDAVVEACRRLKEQGYVLALDDFVFDERYRPLIELADIIKVDFTQTRGDVRRHIVRECGRPGLHFLAEKVETADEFKQALEIGYSYFQGYFFSAPDVMRGKDIPAGKLNYMRILREINQRDIDFEQVEYIIKHDVGLTYKLLRFMNSAFFSFSSKVESIRHALVLLGVREIKKWINLIALGNMGFDKPQELILLALIRASFCEHLASRVGMLKRDADFFLMGLFSVIDGIVDRPMSEILDELPIAQEVAAALLGESNIFRDVFDLVLTYEKGEWEMTVSCARKIKVDEGDLPELFLNSVTWANNAF
jgi:c-di-GMP-related signal transduction protein